MTLLMEAFGVDTLPTTWEEKPLAAVAKERKGNKNTGMKENNLLSLSFGNIIPKDIDGTGGLLPESFEGYQIVEPGDLVMRLTDLQNDKRSLRSGLCSERGIITSAYLALEPTGMEPRYFAYLIRAYDVAKVLYPLGGGLRQSIGFEDIRRLPVVVPPFVEQRRIADFLDDQVGRIDDAITLRDSQLAQLEESLSSRLAVEFASQTYEFGTIPLRRIVSEIRQGWSPQCDDRLPEESEWGVLKAGCVNGGEFWPNALKALPIGVTPRPEFLVREGNLLINRASGSVKFIGNAALVTSQVNPRTLLCDKVYRVKLVNGYDARYFASIWRAPQIRDQIALGISGAEGMANSIPADWLRTIALPKLPKEVQISWGAIWTSRAELSARAEQAILSQIEGLQSRKRSVITAAVTGHLDVATSLPLEGPWVSAVTPANMNNATQTVGLLL